MTNKQTIHPAFETDTYRIRAREAEKIYEEANIEFLVEAMKEDAEEYGDWHEEDCQLNFECGADCDYVCECPKIVILQNFALKWMARVNEKWAENAKAHLPYCKPEGRKILIPLYGGKLKTEEHKRKIAEGVRKAHQMRKNFHKDKTKP